MEMTINSKDLLNKVSKAYSVVRSNNLIPILDYIDFQFTEAGLVLQASDLETTIWVKTAILSGSKEGRVAVQAKTLVSLLKSLKKEPILLKFEGPLLKIKSSTGTYKIPTETQALPNPDIGDFTGKFNIKGYLLSSAVEKTEKFIASDDLKPALNGVCFDIKEDGITIVATDGKRLSRYKTNVGSEPLKLIIPVKPLEQLKGLQDQDVIVSYNDRNVKFQIGDAVVIGRLIDGVYPAYERVIPLDFNYDFKVSKSDLIDTVKRISIFANSASKEIVFKAENGILNVYAVDANYSTSGNEDIEITSAGDITIAFDSSILLGILENLSDGTLLFSFVGSDKPVIVTNAANPALLNLIMPISMS